VPVSPPSAAPPPLLVFNKFVSQTLPLISLSHTHIILPTFPAFSHQHPLEQMAHHESLPISKHRQSDPPPYTSSFLSPAPRAGALSLQAKDGFEITEGTPFDLNPGVLGISFLGWAIPGLLPSNIPLYGTPPLPTFVFTRCCYCPRLWCVQNLQGASRRLVASVNR
jgi:hypothetical protein